jgi:penicillin-insensitive murein endopeptidase
VGFALVALALLVAPSHARSTGAGVSLSVGDATTGRLVGGEALDAKGAGYRLLSKTIQRGFYYGTARLVDAIRRCARAVAEGDPKSTLGIGNLSRQGGGDIPQSRSHNSGRDVDLAFFVLDAKGRPQFADKLVRFGSSKLVSQEGYRFDLERNWRLVRALITDAHVDVDWIFIARWLRVPLLEYARKNIEDEAVLLRAETVLKQPGDSSPHDDHFHVRIYCAPRERLEGECVNYGAVWPWVDQEAEVRALAQVHESRALDDDAGLAERRAAIDALGSLESAWSLGRLWTLTSAPALAPSVLRLAVRLRSARAVAALERDGELAGLPADVAMNLASATSSPALCESVGAVATGNGAPAARARAAEALAQIGDSCALERLASLLGDAEPLVREAARRELSRHMGYPVTRHADFDQHWPSLSALSWEERAARGLKKAGFRVADARFAQRVESLIGALAEPEPFGYNAARLLESLSGLTPPAKSRATAKTLKAWWQSWWKLHQSAFDS